MRTRYVVSACAVAGLLVLLVEDRDAARAMDRLTETAAQEPARPPSLVLESMRGADLFAFYCASCHGSGGKGDGPVAKSLRTPPADLTTIAKRAGGEFPAARVESQITGTGTTLIVSHGTREMPVWGPIFQALDPNSDARTRVRITNLVSHLESLQLR